MRCRINMVLLRTSNALLSYESLTPDRELPAIDQGHQYPLAPTDLHIEQPRRLRQRERESGTLGELRPNPDQERPIIGVGQSCPRDRLVYRPGRLHHGELLDVIEEQSTCRQGRVEIADNGVGSCALSGEISPAREHSPQDYSLGTKLRFSIQRGGRAWRAMRHRDALAHLPLVRQQPAR